MPPLLPPRHRRAQELPARPQIRRLPLLQARALHETQARSDFDRWSENFTFNWSVTGFQVDQPPGPRDRRMFRGPLLQPKPQEAPHPKRVRCTPRHPTLGVQALEVPHQQEPKVASRGQARTPQNRRIEPAASRFHESVEALGLQRSIQTRIERMPRAPRQIARRHPQRLLTFLMFAHRHARTLRHALVT